MKCLTVREPWATLIIEGIKKYEFRSWKTSYRGKMLIHAGSKLEKDSLLRFERYDLRFKCGYIIGEVDLVDCILVDEKFDQELSNVNVDVYGKNSHVGKYAWKLENVKRYDKPIFYKGQLGLWNCDIDK